MGELRAFNVKLQQQLSDMQTKLGQTAAALDNLKRSIT